MDRTLNVALLQIPANGRNIASNLTTGLQACREASEAGADIALFPEMWNVGYELEPIDTLPDLAIDDGDGFLAAFADLAAELELAIAVTFLQRWSGPPRNTVVVFDRRGKRALEYAKVHTCDFDVEHELTAGDRFPVCELDTRAGAVRVGCMICFDALFPEAARSLMLEGAELILVPNSSDYEPWRIGVLQTRSVENMVGVAMANYPGPDTDGHSCAFQPFVYPRDGEGGSVSTDPTVVRAGREPGIYMARFDLDRLRAFRAAETQGDAYRKPSAYAALTRIGQKDPFVREDARR
ncbi:MAG: carbon-nitrogen hydrolase family protein [Actinomycetota bacterium]